MSRCAVPENDDDRHEYPRRQRVVIISTRMVVGRVAEVVSPDVARRAIARSDTAHEFVSRRRVVAGDEDGTATVDGSHEPCPFGLVLVETNIGRLPAPSVFLNSLRRSFEVVADRADGAGGAAARSHSSGATPAEKERHVADAAAFDARELGGRYHALRERVPCRSRYLPNQ